MNGDGVFDLPRVATGERHNERHAGRADGVDDEPVAPAQAVLRETQPAKLIVLVRIRAREVEDALGAVGHDARQRALQLADLDPGESAEDAARRECEEEIRRVPARVQRLGAWYPVPGYCDEEMIFFRVSDLRPPAADSSHKPDDDEDITARSMTIADARAMVSRGDIVDLKTAYALTLITSLSR